MTSYTHASRNTSVVSCSAGSFTVRNGERCKLTDTEDGWTKEGSASGTLKELGNAAPDRSRWVSFGDVNSAKTQTDLGVNKYVEVTVNQT